jgi:hypothetical protein
MTIERLIQFGLFCGPYEVKTEQALGMGKIVAYLRVSTDQHR